MKHPKTDNWAATFAASEKASAVMYTAQRKPLAAYPTCWKCTAIWWGFTISTLAIIGILIFT